MPYIPAADRKKFQSGLTEIQASIKVHGISNGELNYLLTKLGLLYLAKHGTSYNTISDVVKALECAKLELYRRVAAPHEDRKAKENGDVYNV